MKAITYLTALLLTITSCNCQKKALEAEQNNALEANKIAQNDIDMKAINQELPLIEYESMSRGYFRKITIDGGRIYVQSAREAKPAYWELKPEDLKAIHAAYSEIDVTKLADLKAPTEKRFYDGAPITNLIVTKGSDVYRTTDFDGGFPPSYIENLVNTILEVAEKLNK